MPIGRASSFLWHVRAGIAGAVAAVALLGCAMTPERLPELDRRFYYNLDSPNQQQTFLDLRDEDRQSYLEAQGLWQEWAALPAEQRDKIQKSQVEVGYSEFALFMALGQPADTQDRDRAGRNATIHTFIRCSSGPKRGRYVLNNLDCDGTSDETQVALQEGIVVEIKYPN